MAGLGSPLFQSMLEPFQESLATSPPPDVRAGAYIQMDGRPLGQRKLSRRSSKNAGGKPLWHRPSFNKTTGGTLATRTNHSSALNADSMHSLINMDSNSLNDTGRPPQDNDDDQLPCPLSHSVIPDPLGELPAWFKKESDMAAANVSSFRIKYPLHNPQGPRYYRNHHLVPPSAVNPPPLFFSPSFPPMAASVHDRSEDSTRPPGPSRSPSGTPLPTPSSSQVRIPETGGKPSSRKTSQDNIDLMDLSDPWGTHWHHESPYDAGTSNSSPVSVDHPEGTPRSRSRLSSLNAGQPRHKTVNPSPLSQSTSAVHLQAPEPQVTRRLSKRRKPGLAGLFGPHDKGTTQDEAASATSPNTSSAVNRSSLAPSSLHFSTGAARRHSTLSPTSVPLNVSSVALSTHSAHKKEKRGSVLGRLVRRFSVLRRGTQDIGATISESTENEKRDSAPSAGEEGASRRSFFSQRPPSPEKPPAEKRHFDPSKRVPPPRIDSELLTQAENGGGVSSELEREINDHRSSLSGDMPFSPLGKLTITNPDLPSSAGTTPVELTLPLSPKYPGDNRLEPDSQTRDDRCHSESLQTTLGSPSRVGKQLSAPHISPPAAPATGRSSPVKDLLSPLTLPPPSPSPPEVHLTNSSAHFVTRKESPSPKKESSSTPTSSTGDPASVPGPSSHSPEPTRFVPPLLTLPQIDDSPLSRASVLVNPPTPCNADEFYARLPMPTKQSKNPLAEKVSSRDPSPTRSTTEAVPLSKSNSTTSRQTETFRLVRSPSEKKSLSESIMAEGEQWLLVNAEDTLRRRRTKDREEKGTKAERVQKVSSRSRDRESRRTHGKQDKAETSDSRQRATSHAKVKSPPANQRDNSHMSVRPSRALSLDGAQRPVLIQPMVFTLQDEPPRVRKGDDRPRDSSHSKSARAGTSSIVAVARVERVPSGSARPTSELTSTADINSLKAREAWDMDRLWKGRSMYHGHRETTSIPTHPPSSTSKKESTPAKVEPSQQDVVPLNGTPHGSSHTSYVVQPLQAHPVPASVFYANMPTAPPPIIYATTSPYGQVPHPSRDYKTFRSLPDFSFPSDDTSDSPSRPSNPLPVPPRESSYQPAPFPLIPNQSSGSASEYWTKYTSVPLH